MIAHKYDHFFNTEHLKGQLKGKSIHGGLNTFFAEVIVFVLRMGSTVVLARLLMPEHFGLISMVSSITAIAARFKDLGLSYATVQRKVITQEQVSCLFWINVGLGILIALIIAALSYFIAWFYGDQRLVAITLAFSSTFLFGGLAVQHQALLRRQMHFGYLALIYVLSTVFSISISVWLALQGFEYWALVWKEVSNAAFIAIGTWMLCRWLPSLTIRSTGIGSMLKFGGDITAFNIITFFSRSLDQILIGKFWGASPLGFYRQANQILWTPILQLKFSVDYVAQPLLSTLQNEPELYRKYYERIIAILSFILMPMTIYLAVFSEDLILILLGEKWMGSVATFRMFAIAAFIQPLSSTCGFVMVTIGKTKQNLWWGVMNAICVIISICIGVKWGPVGVATALAIYTYVTLVPFLWFGFRNTPVSVPLFFKAISFPVVSSLLTGLLLVLIAPRISGLNSFIEIPLSLILTLSIYSGIWLVFPYGRQKLTDYLSYIRLYSNLTPSVTKKDT
jgi:O-antigen/teichoic acid export membrane protein